METIETRIKKALAIFLVLVLALSVSMPALAAASIIRRVEYEDYGKVEVDFNCRVQYQNARVTVKDSKGKTYSARITEKDSDDLTFKVSNLKAGRTYRFSLSGIRERGTSSYQKYSGRFTVPAAPSAARMIEKIEYEGNGKVEVDFRTKVQYKNVKVTVTDATGKSYKARVTKKDSDDLRFKVTGLKPGRTYKFTISGIRARGTTVYTRYRGEFIASRSHYDDDD